MATRSFAVDNLEGGARAATVSWAGLLASSSDDGNSFLLAPFYADKSVQVVGTFGVGGTLIIEGSNAPNPGAGDWSPLNDPQGNALSFTSSRVETVLENVRHIRPRVTGGDANTNLTVYMLVSTSARR